MTARAIRHRIAIGVALVLAAVTSPPAQAAPPAADEFGSLSAAEQSRQRVQEPLLRLNDRVYDVAAASYDQQFAGARLDVKQNALHVYWVGTVPAALAALRTEAAKGGLTLTVTPSKFSRRQLMAAAERVMPKAELNGRVEVAVDGSGITVAAEGMGAVTRGTRAATATESGLMRRIATVRDSTGIPVTVVEAGPERDVVASRQEDTSPYWGGARMRAGNIGCSTGFSMYASGNTSIRHTLTAAHCASYTDGVQVTNGVGARMGATDFIHELYDLNSYDLGTVTLDPGKTNAPKIYQDEAAIGISVAGYASGGIPANGNYCINGINTRKCNLWSGGSVWTCPSGAPRCWWIIRMTSLDGGTISCRGDSGGPVYFWSADGRVIYAAGIHSTGVTAAGENCGTSGGASVVATAVNIVPGLRVVTTSAP